MCWTKRVRNHIHSVDGSTGMYWIYGKEWVILNDKSALNQDKPSMKSVKISKCLWLFSDGNCHHFRMSVASHSVAGSRHTFPPWLISSTILWDRVPRDVPFMAGLTASGPDEARSSNGIFSSRTALTSQLLEVSLSFQGWLCSCQRDGRASLQS